MKLLFIVEAIVMRENLIGKSFEDVDGREGNSVFLLTLSKCYWKELDMIDESEMERH
jgi:hypothetical protein